MQHTVQSRELCKPKPSVRVTTPCSDCASLLNKSWANSSLDCSFLNSFTEICCGTRLSGSRSGSASAASPPSAAGYARCAPSLLGTGAGRPSLLGIDARSSESESARDKTSRAHDTMVVRSIPAVRGIEFRNHDIAICGECSHYRTHTILISSAALSAPTIELRDMQSASCSSAKPSTRTCGACLPPTATST